MKALVTDENGSIIIDGELHEQVTKPIYDTDGTTILYVEHTVKLLGRVYANSKPLPE